MPFRILPLLLLAAIGVVIAAEVDYPLDAPGPDGRRPGGTLTQSMPAPPIANEENKDLKRERNYPDQPPTIPHSIRGYQIDQERQQVPVLSQPCQQRAQPGDDDQHHPLHGPRRPGAGGGLTASVLL